MFRNSLVPIARPAVASSSRAASLSTVARPAVATAARSVAKPFGTTTQKRGYHEKVIDHYENPRNVSIYSRYLFCHGSPDFFL